MADYSTAATVYGMAVVNYDGARMLWLTEFPALGITRVIVRAAMRLPQIAETDTFATETCQIGDSEPDPELFVVASVKNHTDVNVPVTSIAQAWRANRSTSTFEQLPTDNITCFINPMMLWR